MYKALYLPVNPQPAKIEDGDIVIDARGAHYTYSEVYHRDIARCTIKVARLMIVEFKFNKMHFVGYPSKLTLRWLKPGDELQQHAVKEWVIFPEHPLVDPVPMEKYVDGGRFPDPMQVELRIECPRCGSLH